jgi:hypothetical protein
VTSASSRLAGATSVASTIAAGSRIGGGDGGTAALGGVLETSKTRQFGHFNAVSDAAPPQLLHDFTG